MPPFRYLRILLSLVVFNTGALADESLSQGKLFRQAEHAAATGQRQRYLKLAAELGDYPLLPYAEYADLRRRLGSVSSQEVDAFLLRHDGEFIAHRLRRDWLPLLAKRQQWAPFVQHYRPEMDSVAELQCAYGQALLQTGNEGAQAVMEKLWLTPSSRPAACDRPFALWQKEGGRSNELVWQRFLLALTSRQTSLAEYLQRQLDKSDLPAAALARRVHQQPTLLKGSWRLQGSPRNDDILLLGLKALARSDIPLAAQLWNEQKTAGLNIGDQWLQSVAFQLARTDMDAAMQWLIAQDPSSSNAVLLEARLRLAVQQGDWGRIRSDAPLLPEANRNSDRWRYWYARSLLASKPLTQEQREQARAVLRELAEVRSWYGFLAADMLGAMPSMQHEPLQPNAEQLAEVRAIPGIERAFAWLALGERNRAAVEWWFTSRSLSAEQLATAAVLANQQQWHPQAILSLAQANAWNDIEIRFPLAYAGAIEAEAKRNALDTAWLYAVARQESAFRYDARSSAGATGILQLMSRTAQYTAKGMGMRISDNDLLKPETNIKLGANYLAQLNRQFKGNPLLATAAYNAGPTRVKSWLTATSMPSDWPRWVESIPFAETRQYVQNVMAFQTIYNHRLGTPQRLAFEQPGTKLAANKKASPAS